MMTLNREGMAKGRELYSIDPAPYAKEALAIQDKKFRGEMQNVYFLEGSSHDRVIIDCVPDDIAWLYIDGCHCYDCAYDDIQLWVPKVALGGYVLFHDCANRQDNKRVECPRGGKRRVGVAGAMATAPEMKKLSLVSAGPRRGGCPGLDCYSR